MIAHLLCLYTKLQSAINRGVLPGRASDKSVQKQKTLTRIRGVQTLLRGGRLGEWSGRPRRPHVVVDGAPVRQRRRRRSLESEETLCV